MLFAVLLSWSFEHRGYNHLVYAVSDPRVNLILGRAPDINAHIRV